jgi:1-pyrroline-5-carboxylate dehydrogenase
VVFKGDSKVALVMEQCLRLLHACGLPREDVDFVCGEGPMMEALLVQGEPRMTQFT